jgi:hypothetical protein
LREIAHIKRWIRTFIIYSPTVFGCATLIETHTCEFIHYHASTADRQTAAATCRAATKTTSSKAGKARPSNAATTTLTTGRPSDKTAFFHHNPGVSIVAHPETGPIFPSHPTDPAVVKAMQSPQGICPAKVLIIMHPSANAQARVGCYGNFCYRSWA